MSYLNNGGYLYIESTNIGFDYQGTDFMNYLGIVFLEDGGENEVMSVYGGQDNLTSGMHLNYQGGISPHHSVDRLSSLTGDLLLECESGYARMYMKDNENYKVVASSIVAGALANGDTLNLKPYLMAEIVNFFMGYDPSVGVDDPASEIFIAGAYPNPFREQTTFNYRLENTGPVKISVFNQNGEHIRTLMNQGNSHGNHVVTWDGCDDFGNTVKNGLYIYTIETEHDFSTGKVMKIR